MQKLSNHSSATTKQGNVRSFSLKKWNPLNVLENESNFKLDKEEKEAKQLEISQ